ncbi:bifunctional aspartate kinase/homoserine dehydrogenase I [Persicitalea jodogahamensis]|uniref:Bifunctional aspartate kinase/homoserine dehydrogenase I n=1 Tax=Persicitalea jodogahamensis TaxID=402147 RepID=A0A8J3D5U1_9BACT|nr:bifunctional aspartate kinase/homoserine dehydrogenase I [Persicitalea jodogahamensis]GHB79559.1 bifunctional aspartate kinase/homoserine dehydrogenase I [Persicitalea jodogahamensis]
MKVLKFGGTSVGSVESIKLVIEILEKSISKGERTAVVFSAMGGATNRLIEIGRMAAAGNQEYFELLKVVEERHFATIRGLINVKQQSGTFANIKGLFNELEDILRGVSLIRELTDRTMDLIMSFGERLSTNIITEALKNIGVKAEFCDARQLVRTNDHFGMADVDFATTNQLILEHFAKSSALQCITGFIGATAEGITTTLGRGGSDYTASIFGAALDAQVIEIWTDVDGMMTADPRKVPNAFTIPAISYAEAMELSHFGAKVIYPPSLQPAFAKNIPLKVLNTFNIGFEGTLVDRSANHKQYAITGISSIDDMALVNIQGSGMIGVAGISARLFTTLSENNISVVLISQASSEHSICFTIDHQLAERAQQVLEAAFEVEIKSGDIDSIAIEKNVSIIAIVGEGMRKSSGVAGKLFSVLGKNGINIIATAQGSSELNISVVISKNDLSKALNAIHGVFFLSETRSLNLFIVGVGLIGGTLLEQVGSQSAFLSGQRLLKLNIAGLSNTKKMLLEPGGIAPDRWREELADNGVKTSIPAFVDRIIELNLPNSVFVDCTSDKDIVRHYGKLLDASISVVTPNKVANSGRYDEYQRLQRTALQRGVKFLYETNVGAGLPIINTIQGLMDSGDKFIRIEAILSGTLSYIFNTFGPGVRFADVVREAKAKGYTEPDPRDDLSGTDVARKILILAREVGVPMEPEEVKIAQLLPDNCLQAPTVEAFFAELENSNSFFEGLLDGAKAKDGVLRYIATLENNKATVELRAVDEKHPFYNLSGSDNIVSFTTDRYKDRPLVVKGPGAGAEVTASGVFADIMSISSYLG